MENSPVCEKNWQHIRVWLDPPAEKRGGAKCQVLYLDLSIGAARSESKNPGQPLQWKPTIYWFWLLSSLLFRLFNTHCTSCVMHISPRPLVVAGRFVISAANKSESTWECSPVLFGQRVLVQAAGPQRQTTNTLFRSLEFTRWQSGTPRWVWLWCKKQNKKKPKRCVSGYMEWCV